MNRPKLSDVMAAALLNNNGPLVRALQRTADGKTYISHDSMRIERFSETEEIVLKFCLGSDVVWTLDPMNLPPNTILTLSGIPGRMEVTIA